MIAGNRLGPAFEVEFCKNQTSILFFKRAFGQAILQICRFSKTVQDPVEMAVAAEAAMIIADPENSPVLDPYPHLSHCLTQRLTTNHSWQGRLPLLGSLLTRACLVW
jgi:hypothetical protein